ELSLEQVGSANVVGGTLDAHRLPLLLAAAPGRLAGLGQARRLLPLVQRRQQRAMHDEGRIAADRRGEVAGAGTAEPGVTAGARLRSSSWATCSLARIIKRSISRWDSVCATARAPTTLPSASKRNSGSKDSTSRLVAPRCSPSAAAASLATDSGSATDSGAL